MFGVMGENALHIGGQGHRAVKFGGQSVCHRALHRAQVGRTGES